MARPVRVAVANDYEIVVAGLAAMLARCEDIVVCDTFVVGEAGPPEPVDVVMYDTFGREGIDDEQLSMLLRTPRVAHVAVFTLSWAEALVTSALDLGVAGVISKSLGADELASCLRDIVAGKVVVAPPPGGRTSSGSGRDWPGRALGLSERESEALVLLAAGLRNAEIATALYLSEDTVKTHLKRAYSKIGVSNRAQATNLVLRHPSFAGREAPIDGVTAGAGAVSRTRSR
jgi:DNA-binding NarL/FixJ family response regulator